MNKVIDKGFRSCRFVSTIVKCPVLQLVRPNDWEAPNNSEGVHCTGGSASLKKSPLNRSKALLHHNNTTLCFARRWYEKILLLGVWIAAARSARRRV